MRRIVPLVVVALTLAVAAVATAQSQAPDTEPITLNVWVRNYTLDQDSPYKTAKAAFEAAHPNVIVELSGAPYDEQYQRILLSKAGGTKPDVFQMDTIWLGQMAQEGLAANLDQYYASFDQASDIPANYLASSKWDGSYYGVWLNSDVRLFLWNKDLFTQAGLDPETPPATWDEVVTMAKQVQDKVPGVAGVGFPALAQEATADRWYPLLWMGGGDILSPDFKTATFNSPAGVNATQFLVDLVNRDGVTPKDVLGQDDGAILNALFAGKTAMMLSNAGTGLEDIQGMTPDEYVKHFGAAQIPLCDGCQPASGSGGWLLGVNAQSAHPDLAFEFIDLVTSPANITDFLIAQRRVPTRTSLLDEVDTLSKDNPYFAEVAKAAAVTHFAPWVPQYAQILETIYTAIQQSIQDGGNVQANLDAAVEQSNALLSQ